MPIHGFYYGNAGKGLAKLKADKTTLDYVERRIIPALEDVSPEDYWRRYAKGMITHAPQGYIAWHGASLWVLNDGELKVVEFTPRMIRACTLGLESDADDLEEDPEEDLCRVPWDWMLEDGCAGKSLSKREVEEIDQNVGWTAKLHEECSAIVPIENL